ncbi:hypothetical protein HY991_00570 [Candidatus Micrarchaeota archaeon]|nr:hypothetical protein [Candidatus Micrarchaeota archaeon]
MKKQREKHSFAKRIGKKGFSTPLLTSLKFLGLFLVLFIFSYQLLSRVSELNLLAARSTEFFLGFFGKPVATVTEKGVPFIRGDGINAEIGGLCSGAMEIAVLFGIVFATFERSLKSRAIGLLLGLFLVLVFNPFRIAVTLLFTGTPFLLVLVHELLFRLSLILFIVFYYAFWFYWLSVGFFSQVFFLRKAVS